jgi:MarR family transcriptional regulator, organic hydroperoxide resistance regulator
MTDQRVFLLLQQAAHRMRIWADRRCVELAGVTTAQTGALFALRDAPMSTQRELAASLGQRESAVTAMVRRLLDAGLVDRHPSPDDHRAHLLALTATGEATLATVRPVVAEFNATLRRLLGADGPAALAAALRTLRDADEFR